MIDYALVHSGRSRRLSILVHPSGDVVVKMPLGFSHDRAQRFVEEKKGWILRTQERLRKIEKNYEGGLRLPKSNKRDFEAYKSVAFAQTLSRLAFFNKEHYGGRFKWQRGAIRNQKSRWGSCSKRGNLQFNYKIVLLPANLADYLVVHELCHLGEFNHSKKFWDLVEIAVPGYKTLRKELRRVRSA